MLVGLAGAGLASVWLFLTLERQSRQPGSAAFLAVAGFVAATAQVVLAGLQLRQGNRAVAAEPVAPSERREREARDRLRQYLGRQAGLRRMDETSALALRVHPAIDLPRPPQPKAAVRAKTDSRLERLRRRFLRRSQRDMPQDVQTLDRDLPAFSSVTGALRSRAGCAGRARTAVFWCSSGTRR